MKRLILVFKAELYKTKNNMAVLLFLLCPLVAITYAYVTQVIDTYTSVRAGELVEIGNNPWINLIGKQLIILYLFYPILVSILVYSLCDMEYRNRNFKRLFTLPFPVQTQYTSKIVFLIETMFLSSLIAYTSFIAGGFVLSHALPVLKFQDYDIRLACFYLHVRLFISLLTVSFIQYALSLLFKNFVVPVGFGGFITLFSLLTMNKPWSYLNPYATVFNSFNDFINYQSVSFGKHEYACFVYLFVFLFINYFIFKRQKVN